MNTALAAAESLAIEGFDPTVVNCRFLKPYDSLTLSGILADHRQILVVEEGTVINGFGSYMALNASCGLKPCFSPCSAVAHSVQRRPASCWAL